MSAVTGYEPASEAPSHNAQCVERESCGTTHANPERVVTKPGAQQTENMQGASNAGSSRKEHCRWCGGWHIDLAEHERNCVFGPAPGEQ